MRLLGLPWRAVAADVDERAYVLDDPLVAALNVAAAKSRALDGAPDEVILSADTLVVCDGLLLGKPADADQARGMLARIRARSHLVLSGIVLRAHNGLQWGGVVSTRVVMRDYGEVEVEEYVARGEPFDKAGGYAIQDEVFRPVEELEGCYLNVVGLPLCAAAAGLAALGVEIGASADRTPPCELCRAGAPLVSIRSAY